MVTLKNTLNNHCWFITVEGSWVPGASPSLNILIFKMRIKRLVLQSGWKSWPIVGPAINMTLPLIWCQLFILKISHDLRGWHTYGLDIHIGIWQEQKKTLCFMRSILSLPLTVFLPGDYLLSIAYVCFQWVSSHCTVLNCHFIGKGWEMLCTASDFPPRVLCGGIPTSMKPEWHSSDSSWNREGFLAVSQLSKSKQLVSPLFHSGHPINFKSQNIKLQKTLWVG